MTTNEPTSAQDESALEATYVPANVLAVAVVRPADLLPIYKQARAKVGGAVSEEERHSSN